MESEQKFIRKEVKEILIYLFIGALLVIILPIIFGFAFKGFEESFTSGNIKLSDYLGAYLTYLPFAIGSLLVIIYPISRLIAFKKEEDPITKENPTWFRILTMSYIFNPEEGLLFKAFQGLGISDEKNPMRWSKNIIRVIFVSIIIFGWLAIFQVQFPQLNVSGIPETAQQITLASNLSFGAGLPAFTENGTIFLIFFLLLGINAYICSKFKLGWTGFFTICLFIVLFMGIVWMGIHRIVYGNIDAKLFATFVFGSVGALITILTGVFIFWLVWHIFNNVALTIYKALPTNENALFYLIIFMVLITISYGIGEYLVWRYKKKRYVEPPIA